MLEIPFFFSLDSSPADFRICQVFSDQLQCLYIERALKQIAWIDCQDWPKRILHMRGSRLGQLYAGISPHACPVRVFQGCFGPFWFGVSRDLDLARDFIVHIQIGLRSQCFWNFKISTYFKFLQLQVEFEPSPPPTPTYNRESPIILHNRPCCSCSQKLLTRADRSQWDLWLRPVI